jgi:hypothetical protein
MSPTTIALFRAAIIFIAPLALLAAFIFHPHVGNPIDDDFLVKFDAAVTADPTRWAVVHYISAVAIGLLTLAFIALRGYLYERGENSWSRTGLPLVVMGNVFYAMLPAFEFAPYAAVKTGFEAGTIQEALMPWFFSTVLTSALLFTLGVIGFAVGIVRSNIFDTGLRWIVPVALIVMGVSRFVPLNFVQFYVQSLAGIVSLIPLGYLIWKYSDSGAVIRPRPVTDS